MVPTPIGNLEDITLRALRTLREADLIACEDTRHTLKLLNHFDIHKPLISYHQHNERTRTEELIARAEAGELVALVSDAGTPCISDPGSIIVRAALDRGLPVDVLPGPNAPLPALILSGLSAEIFTFAGFIEGSAKEREKALSLLSQSRATLIFYVAPHSLLRELAFFAEKLGGRRAALVREISKIHQECIRGTLPELMETAKLRTLKGEMVLVVEGCKSDAAESDGRAVEWQKLALAMKDEGISDRDIAAVLLSVHGVPRNSTKAFLLNKEDS